MKIKPVEDTKQRETSLEGFASTCSVLAVGLFVLTFVFQNFVIPSSSMASTLLVGDHVMVERENLAGPADWAPFVHYREIKRGDIIVFYKPVAESNGEHIPLVKRVIGIPGDRIHLRNGGMSTSTVLRRTSLRQANRQPPTTILTLTTSPLSTLLPSPE